MIELGSHRKLDIMVLFHKLRLCVQNQQSSYFLALVIKISLSNISVYISHSEANYVENKQQTYYKSYYTWDAKVGGS